MLSRYARATNVAAHNGRAGYRKSRLGLPLSYMIPHSALQTPHSHCPYFYKLRPCGFQQPLGVGGEEGIVRASGGVDLGPPHKATVHDGADGGGMSEWWDAAYGVA